MDKSLKDLLQSDEIYSTDPADLFNRLADTLLNKCIIRVNGKVYRMLEIEFYLYSSTHKDLITYPREEKGGNWFFHQSGVDICFKSKCDRDGAHFSLAESNQFGGILIRSILEIGNDLKYHKDLELVHGPMKCVDILFKSFGALDDNRCESQIPYIDECVLPEREIVMQTQRHIPVNGGVRNKIENILSSTYKTEKDKINEVDVESFAKYIEENTSYTYRYYIEPKNDKLWKNYNAKPKNGKVVSK